MSGQPALGESRRWTETHSVMGMETKPQTDVAPGSGTAQAAKGLRHSAQPKWGSRWGCRLVRPRLGVGAFFPSPCRPLPPQLPSPAAVRCHLPTSHFMSAQLGWGPRHSPRDQEVACLQPSGPLRCGTMGSDPLWPAGLLDSARIGGRKMVEAASVAVGELGLV